MRTAGWGEIIRNRNFRMLWAGEGNLTPDDAWTAALRRAAPQPALVTPATAQPAAQTTVAELRPAAPAGSYRFDAPPAPDLAA